MTYAADELEELVDESVTVTVAVVVLELQSNTVSHISTSPYCCWQLTSCL